MGFFNKATIIVPVLAACHLFLCPTGAVWAGSIDAAQIAADPAGRHRQAAETAETQASPLPEPYVDQLIDGGAGDEPDIAGESDAAARWPGFSALSLTGRTYIDDNRLTGRLEEYGLQLYSRMESLNNGIFEVSADGLYSDDRQEETDQGGRVLLRHHGLVLNDAWQMDSEIGHLRSRTPSLISTSYRMQLPTSLLQGVGASVFNQRTTLSATAGDIGSLQGMAAQQFETRQGSLQGASLTHTVDDRWQMGTQFWNTTDTDDADGHQSYAGALQYTSDRQQHQLHALIDSHGNAGVWYDNEIPVGRWKHYLGIYHLQPELQWTDVLINNDRQGGYWRADFRSFRWQWTVGSDLFVNNLDADPDLAGFLESNAFINGSWRFRHDSLLGGSMTLATRDADSGTATGDTLTYRLKSFVTRDFSFGTSRLQAELDRLDDAASATYDYRLIWDQVWQTPYFRQLSTYAEYLNREADPGEVKLQVVLEKALGNDFWLRASGQYTHVLKSSADTDDAVNASLGMNWQMNRQWRLELTADYNRSQVISPETDIKPQGYTLLLSLSYAISGPGRPYPLQGLQTDNLGSGEIRGRVYLDANRNGRYDPDETALQRIVVFLDSGFQTETDVNGQFTFWPVAAGEHRVTIGIEDVPLPWNSKDDQPTTVYVPVRGVGEIDFGLIRLDE
jgi:hypothetical protein